MQRRGNSKCVCRVTVNPPKITLECPVPCCLRRWKGTSLPVLEVREVLLQVISWLPGGAEGLDEEILSQEPSCSAPQEPSPQAINPDRFLLLPAFPEATSFSRGTLAAPMGQDPLLFTSVCAGGELEALSDNQLVAPWVLLSPGSSRRSR